MVQFLDFPTEVIQSILNHLELSDLLSVADTCSRLKATVYNSRKLIENCHVHPLACSRTSITNHLSQIQSREQIRVLDLFGAYWIPRSQLTTLILRCTNLEELFVLGTTLNYGDVTRIMAQLTKIIKLSFGLDDQRDLAKDNNNLFKNVIRLCIKAESETLKEWFYRQNLENLEVVWLITDYVFTPITNKVKCVIVQSQCRAHGEIVRRAAHNVIEEHDGLIALQRDIAPFGHQIAKATVKRNCLAQIFVWKNNMVTPSDLQADYLDLINGIDVSNVDKLEIKINGTFFENSQCNEALAEWINKSNIQRKIQKMAVNDVFMKHLNDENTPNLFSNLPNMEIFEMHAERSNKYTFVLRNICVWKNLKELTLTGIHNDMSTLPQVAENLPSLEVLRVEVFSINGVAYYNISVSLPKFKNLKEFKYKEPISLESLNRMFTSLEKCIKLQSAFILINSLGNFNKRDFVYNCVRVLQMNSLRFFGLLVFLFHSSDVTFLRKALKKQVRKEMSIYISSKLDSIYASEFPLYYQMRYIKTESRVADRTLQSNTYFCDLVV